MATGVKFQFLNELSAAKNRNFTVFMPEPQKFTEDDRDFIDTCINMSNEEKREKIWNSILILHDAPLAFNTKTPAKV